MRISILIVCFLGQSFSLLAQTDPVAVSKKQITYFNNFLAGGLFGESGQGTGLTLSTTHGIRIKRLAVGAGVGLDSYLDWQAVPVFGSISFDFGRIKQNALFLQFNAGYSSARRIKKEEWLLDYSDYGSEMISSMIGYRITTQRFSLYVLAGHKFQQVNYSYNPTPWVSAYPQSNRDVTEEMNRLVVQIGFGLR